MSLMELFIIFCDHVVGMQDKNATRASGQGNCFNMHMQPTRQLWRFALWPQQSCVGRVALALLNHALLYH